jgi:hypothetical protein
MTLQWSKMRQLCEQRIAPELSGRVRLRLTRMRGAHDAEQHGAILVDDAVWFDACFFKTTHRVWDIQRNGQNGPDAEQQAQAEGFVPGWQFGPALRDYLNENLESSLCAENPVRKIMAVMDARLGKRRMNEVLQSLTEHDPARKFLELRMRVRGVETETDKAKLADARMI